MNKKYLFFLMTMFPSIILPGDKKLTNDEETLKNLLVSVISIISDNSAKSLLNDPFIKSLDVENHIDRRSSSMPQLTHGSITKKYNRTNDEFKVDMTSVISENNLIDSAASHLDWMRCKPFFAPIGASVLGAGIINVFTDINPLHVYTIFAGLFFTLSALTYDSKLSNAYSTFKTATKEHESLTNRHFQACRTHYWQGGFGNECVKCDAFKRNELFEPIKRNLILNSVVIQNGDGD